MAVGLPDIRSPRGQANERHNEKCWSVLMDHFCSLRFAAVRQPLHDLHPADGVVRDRNTRQPLYLIEVKSRSNFTEREFWGRHNGEWLISNHKITANIPIARSMGVPFLGAMHIVRSRVVLLKTIWDGKVCQHSVRRLQTQANINGGSVIRDNAFIPMRDAVRLVYEL